MYIYIFLYANLKLNQKVLVNEKYYFELGKLLKKHGNEVAYFSMKDDRNIKTENIGG